MTTHWLLLVCGRSADVGPFRTAFARRGWRVEAVWSADEAIAALERGPEPCCVIIHPRPKGCRAGEILERAASLGYRSRLVVRHGRPIAMAEYLQGRLLPRPITTGDIWEQACPVCEPRDDEV